jgi:putative ABC transport system permease protein
MGTKDISTIGLVIAFSSVAVSLVVYRVTRVGLYRELLVSMGRMSVQLALVGLYLTALFELNHPLLTIGYLLLMVAAANYSVLRNSGLRGRFFAYTFPALLISIGAVLAFFIALVYAPSPLYDARYLIPIAGMLLGNSMNRTIITTERFYSSVKQDPDGLAALLTCGATTREATAPYLRIAYRAGVSPALANLATMGIVSLPGMMTGQILGGSSPLVAIEYQITIILAIFVATDLAALLCIFLSMRRGFDDFGFLRTDIFKTL